MKQHLHQQQQHVSKLQDEKQQVSKLMRFILLLGSLVTSAQAQSQSILAAEACMLLQHLPEDQVASTGNIGAEA